MENENTQTYKGKGPIIIFDGFCNFCDASVGFIMKRDPKQVFTFTANQHETGQQILRDHGLDPHHVGTLYLLEKGKLYNQSTAALRIARYLKTPWNWAYQLIHLPQGLRDSVYNWIARNRYSWFGKKETCRMPTPAERARFI